MDNHLNFLYCFDENYNVQAFTSIISLLDNLDEDINIHILHDDENTLNDLPKVIIKHKNLKTLSIYKFNDRDYYFPNIEKVHISVATYFRLFIENYLPEDVDNIIYLDPDVICLTNPAERIRNKITNLTKSEKVISARTEHRRGEKRIDVDSLYFNAGVMLIDLNKWRKQSIQKKLLINLGTYKETIYQWDQDVLNSLFNGDYIELSNEFNYKPDLIQKITQEQEILFMHYAGSDKPWLTSGIFINGSDLYHQNFKKLGLGNYHITHKWKRQSLFDIFKGLIFFRIFKLDHPLSYFKDFLVSLWRK